MYLFDELIWVILLRTTVVIKCIFTFDELNMN